jgi:hypothetical protein
LRKSRNKIPTGKVEKASASEPLQNRGLTLLPGSAWGMH